MLLHLTIRNVAIIEQSSVELHDGLNVFTGETGAGKSILIDSLALALGGRSNADLVRTGAEEASVSALFALEPEHSLVARLRDAGIPIEGELLLRRMISSNGRSRAYINERPVTIAFLRDMGQQLCEISGQHEHQHLLHPKMHLYLLDSYGNLVAERNEVTQQYEAVRNLRKELEQLGGDTHNRARRRGYLQFQIDELSEAELNVDEAELERERRYLLQLEQMIEAAQFGEESLYSGRHSVMEVLGRLQHKLSHYQDISQELSDAAKSLQEAEALVDDAMRTLRSFANDSSFDPNELEELQERITRLRDLKRKHGVSDLQGLQRCLQEYEEELKDLDRREARMEMLEANYQREVEKLQTMARALSLKRREVSQRLAKDVEHELASLGMKKAQFLVEITEAQFSSFDDAEQKETLPPPPPTEDTHDYVSPALSFIDRGVALPGPAGYDQIQFLLSSNPGEEPRAMHRIASGGELSRIMLSLKQIIAENDPVPTCIFDEVDAGIGGVTATTIGQKISEIARTRQVLCITHLPQIACYAHHHFHIEKLEEGGRTRSTIRPLSIETREQEIARMLGGMGSNAQSIAHARELLTQAHPAPPRGKEKIKATKESPTPKKTKGEVRTTQANGTNGTNGSHALPTPSPAELAPQETERKGKKTTKESASSAKKKATTPKSKKSR